MCVSPDKGLLGVSSFRIQCRFRKGQRALHCLLMPTEKCKMRFGECIDHELFIAKLNGVASLLTL